MLTVPITLEANLKSQHCASNIHAKCRFHKYKMSEYQPVHMQQFPAQNYPFI